MAITRSQNWLGSQRVDVPHLRAQESAVCYDFDVLAGQIMGGRKPLIVKGFTINVNGTLGADPTTLTMGVAGGLIMHYGASESGSIFAVGDDVAAETLDASNANVLGGFTANTINYIGLDLLRATDDSTADSVQFLDSNTLLEVTQTVDLARTLQYKIVISTQNFSVSSNILPVAKVITNATNGITSITDARPMMFRLGSGGDSVNASSTYSWGTRTENSVSYTGTTDPFTAEDKTINDLKSWIDAIMTSLWEVRGGEYWYSKSVRDNVKLIYTSSVLTYNADNFALQVSAVTGGGGGSQTRVAADVTVITDSAHTFVVGQTVYLENSSAKFTAGPKVVVGPIAATEFHYTEAGTAGTDADAFKFNSCTWKGLKLIFENTPAYWYNTIQDNTETAGIGLLEDQCVYVDLVRSSNATVVPVVASIPSVGTSVIPGRRFILAWRIGDLLYTRDRSFESGRIFSPLATIAVPGLVILSRATVASPPAVISIQGGTITPPDNTTGLSVVAAAAGNNTALSATGKGTGKGIIGISGGSGVSAYGVWGQNSGSSAPAVFGSNTFAGACFGVLGTVTNAAGYGVYGTGGATGAGVVGAGGAATPIATFASSGQGGIFQGAAGSSGITSYGNGAGAGGTFIAGATAGCIAVNASGTNASGIAVKGVSTTSGGHFESTGNTVSTGALYAEATGGANPAAIWAKAWSAGSTAVHAEKGHITVEDTSSRFQYNTGRTRIMMIDSSMMIVDGITAEHIVGTMSSPSYVTNVISASAEVSARILLPKGAIITAVDIATDNTDGIAQPLYCYIMRFDKDATHFTLPPTYANLGLGGGDTISCNTGKRWSSVPLIVASAGRTVQEDSFFNFYMVWDAGTGATNLDLHAIRVTYTCQEVSGIMY